MRHQGSEAGQEEEDKARDQNLTESCWWPQHCCAIGCCSRQPGWSILYWFPKCQIGSDLYQSKTPSLIFEYVNNTDFRTLYPKFTDFDVRYYIFELLKVRLYVYLKNVECILMALRLLISAIAKASCIGMSSLTTL